MAEATAAVAAASSCREAVAAVNVTMAVPLPCPDIEVYHIILAVKFHSHYMTTQCTFTDEFLVACTSANVAPVRGAVKEKQKYCILYAEYIINKNRRKKNRITSNKLHWYYRKILHTTTAVRACVHCTRARHRRECGREKKMMMFTRR